MRWGTGEIDEGVPFADACKRVLEEEVFLVKCPTDLFGGSHPAEGLCFDSNSKHKPRTLFEMPVAMSTPVQPLSRKAPRTVREYGNAPRNKTILIRDPSTGDLFSWFTPDIGRFSLWTEDTLTALRTLHTILNCTTGKIHAMLKKLVAQALISIPGKQAFGSQTRIAICDVVVNFLHDEIDKPLVFLAYMGPPKRIRTAYVDYWTRVFRSGTMAYVARSFVSDDSKIADPRLATGKLLHAATHPGVLAALKGTDAMNVAVDVVGSLCANHEPLTRNFHCWCHPRVVTYTLDESVSKVLTRITDTDLFQDVKTTLATRPLEELVLARPKLILCATSLLAFPEGTIDAEQTSRLIQAISRTSDPVVFVAGVKALALYCPKGGVTPRECIEMLEKLTVILGRLTIAKRSLSMLAACAVIFRDIFIEQLSKCWEENPEVAEVIRPCPREPKALELLLKAGVLRGLLFPWADRFLTCKAWIMVSAGRSVDSWAPGRGYGEADPIDKEDFEEGEPLVIFEKCGHAVRMENMLDTQELFRCPVCSVNHPPLPFMRRRVEEEDMDDELA